MPTATAKPKLTAADKDVNRWNDKVKRLSAQLKEAKQQLTEAKTRQAAERNPTTPATP